MDGIVLTPQQVFGRLTVIEKSVTGKHGHWSWRCICSCGKEVIARGAALKNGTTRSCGCLQKIIATKHGMCKNRPLYSCWFNMINRCSNSKSQSYKYYGARGIKVCPEWKNIKTFCDWAIGHGYKDDLEIDRINTDGNYEPKNCRFVTKQVNCLNRRDRKRKEKLPRGVYKSDNKYMALIRVKGKALYLGMFSSKKEASKVYKKEKCLLMNKIMKEVKNVYGV